MSSTSVRQDDLVLNEAVNILRDHGSPLIWPAKDGGVSVAKGGVWAHGRTLPEALERLKENLRTAEAARKGGPDG